MPDLTLMTVHAHPDDESSKGAGTVAKYHAQGIATVLVTCTGGEQGDILNPAMDKPGVKERLDEIRKEELADAAGIIGYDQLIMLGYKDSGMPGTPANSDPGSFAQAPQEEAVGKLVAAIRKFRPQVVVTYPREQSGYPHPDHLRDNEISELAFDAAGDPDGFRNRGAAWQPSKLYYTQWSVRRVLAVHEKFLELGLESPVDAKWLKRLKKTSKGHEDSITTRVDITGFGDVMRRALLAHATQIDPTSKLWFGLPEDVSDTLMPVDEYTLARNLTDSRPPEDDLFAGVRESVAS